MQKNNKGEKGSSQALSKSSAGISSPSFTSNTLANTHDSSSTITPVYWGRLLWPSARPHRRALVGIGYSSLHEFAGE